MGSLKVLHLTTHLTGGAGKAVVRIHRLMKNSGIDSLLLARSGESFSEQAIVSLNDYSLPKKATEVLRRKLQFYPKYNVYSARDYSSSDLVTKIEKLGFEPNVIILHWVANFVSLADIRKLKNKYKSRFFWFSMDMAPLTGGCHYSWGCNGYLKDCSSCEAARGQWGFDKPAIYFAHKKEIIRECEVSVIVPNRWVLAQAKESGLNFKSINLCYLPLDSSIFTPSVVANSGSVITIFFGAININDSRKGGRYFIQSMSFLHELLIRNNIDPAGVKVVIPGEKRTSLEEEIPFLIERIGFASTDIELAEFYQNADIFVSTSMEDSGPMMVLESLMSGTPVAAFDIGVSKEVLETSYNGYLVRAGDVEQLASSILNFVLLSKSQKNILKGNARQSVLNLMSCEIHSQKLLDIIVNNDLN
tara:strand:- start:318 stop:1568 length:1251 start_codon:yes stop_codon:yes gene_type:complete